MTPDPLNPSENLRERLWQLFWDNGIDVDWIDKRVGEVLSALREAASTHPEAAAQALGWEQVGWEHRYEDGGNWILMRDAQHFHEPEWKTDPPAGFECRRIFAPLQENSDTPRES